MSREIVSPSHQMLYKRKALLPWKETFRERCLKRLKTNRQRVVDQLRGIPKDITKQDDSIIREVMNVEWDDIWEHQISKHSDVNDFMTSDEWIDEQILMFQEIQQELMIEEQLILKEHNINVEIEEDYIKRAISADVMCPICQKLPLEQISSVILCLCGFRLETEQENLKLEDFHNKLFEGFHSHNSSCNANPCFSTTNLGGNTNLLISCPVCDFMHIVL